MSSSLQVAGLASNFDWKSFVDSIMDLEHAPADRLTTEKTTNTQKVNLLNSLGTKLTALQTSAQALNSMALFGKRSATSATTGSTWKSSAATDTAIGSYKIAVSQLATSALLTGASDIGSALNPASDDVSGLTLANLPIGQAATAGTFTVNGKQVTVALTDSLDDVFQAISTATGGDVTAAYDHTSDKITLTSTNGNVVLGAANDTSNLLRALKLGNNGTTSVTSSLKLGAVKPSATLAASNLATAVAGSGSFAVNGVSISYDASTDTLSAVLKRINDSSAGVSATYDTTNDRVVVTNKSTGDLGVSLSDTSGSLLSALGLTAGTTFARGNNAEFTINDGDTLSSASNTLDSTVHGVSGLSVTVNAEETQTVTVAADTSAMRGKIEDFVDDFNTVQQFLETNTKVSTDSKGKVTAAVLANNREIQEWGRSLRTMAFGVVSGLTGSVKRLNDLGIDFKAASNELEIEDGTKLDDALKDATTDVDAFFTTSTTGFAARLSTYIEKIGTQNSDQQDRINKTNTSLDDQIAAIERRLTQQRALMESAFIHMESAQSKIKQQQTAIDGMFAQKSS